MRRPSTHPRTRGCRGAVCACAPGAQCLIVVAHHTTPHHPWPPQPATRMSMQPPCSRWLQKHAGPLRPLCAGATTRTSPSSTSTSHTQRASTAPPNPFVGYALPPHIEALRAAPRMRVTVKRAAGIGFGLKIHGGINTALEVFKIKGRPSHVRARFHSAHCGPQALFLEAQRTWLASVWTMCLWPLTESRKICRERVAFQHEHTFARRLLGIEYDDAKEYFLRAGQTAVIEFVAKANYPGRAVQAASEVRLLNEVLHPLSQSTRCADSCREAQQGASLTTVRACVVLFAGCYMRSSGCRPPSIRMRMTCCHPAQPSQPRLLYRASRLLLSSTATSLSPALVHP